MKTLFPFLFFFLSILICNAQTVEIELFKSGFSSPVNLQHAGDERLFVVEQGGRIKILRPDGTVNATPFLDISGQISSGGEQGLLGLAFHPDYATNGYFFVNYTDPNGDTQVSRFSVDAGNPDLADPTSELPIIDYAQPFSNHNGGCLAFGPDGYLYISSGDGGSGGDPGDRAQNLTLLLGKLLRIDIDNPSGGNNYGIPADNPFAASSINRKEIWAYGLRNPWKFSFDSATNDLWIADVGQGNWEEIDRAGAAEAGLNYGWRCYEGSQPFNTEDCPPVEELTFPFAEYSSGSGSGNCSVTGGNVYRGSEFPDLQGLYFFADLCSGLIGTVDDAGNLVEHGNHNMPWVSFGTDIEKNLYIVEHGGGIYKIIGDPLAVPGFESPNALKIFPNPVAGILMLSVENDLIEQIEITDLKGSILISKTEKAASKKELDVSALSQGIYIARITTGNGKTYLKKIIVE